MFPWTTEFVAFMAHYLSASTMFVIGFQNFKFWINYSDKSSSDFNDKHIRHAAESEHQQEASKCGGGTQEKFGP